MVESSFSSARNDAFSSVLRVLVVDADPTRLKILENMLKKCSYEVTTCVLARDALKLLQERKDRYEYDIVMSGVNFPENDMNGFELLEHVGLEMDLPVILMSVDGKTSTAMKGVQHGACDYLVWPIRLEQLRNIRNHVYGKKINVVGDDEVFELTSAKKRKDNEKKHEDSCDSSSTKKARVVWSVDLHQKFINAVNQIGFDKVDPEKILDRMNLPWLTRENIGSHLQKYRLYLTRMQKENNLDSSDTQNPVIYMKERHASNYSFGLAGQLGFKCDSPPCDSSDSIGSQNSCNILQIDGFLLRNVEPRSYESDQEEAVSMPVALGPSTVSESSDICEPCSDSRNSRSEYTNPSPSISSGSDVNNIAQFDSTFLFGPKPESPDQ